VKERSVRADDLGSSRFVFGGGLFRRLIANSPRTEKPPKPRILANIFRPKKISPNSENRAAGIRTRDLSPRRQLILPIAAVSRSERLRPRRAPGLGMASP